MTDIVERLRAEYKYADTEQIDEVDVALLKDAADEIERLRAALFGITRLINDVGVFKGPTTFKYTCGANAKAKAEAYAKASQEADEFWRKIEAAKNENTHAAAARANDDVLGLGAKFTREDVMRAFRQQAQKYHPDKGGDPDIFRRLVEARDRALRAAAWVLAI
jgi:hypothetical protein